MPDAPPKLGVTITEDNLHEFVAWEEDYYQRIDALTALIQTTIAASDIDPTAAKRDPVIIVNALDAQHPDWQERYPGSDFETALYAYRMEPEPTGQIAYSSN